MKMRDIVASITLTVLPVNNWTCNNHLTIPAPPPKVSSEEPIQKPESPKQNTGVLESGKWAIIYQKEGGRYPVY